MERRQVRLGLIGFGEVGNGIGSGLRKEGLESVAAYDIAAFEGPFAELIQGRARAAGVELVRSPEALAQAADYIIAVTPGSECVVAAESVAPYLDEHHRYLDIASATPTVKQAVGTVLERGGALVGDGGIMGSPLNDGHAVLVKISGPAATEFHEAFVPWGMRLDVVGTALGAGSGIKIVRSVVMKGMEALFIECALASGRLGIQDEVFASISEFMDARPFFETVKFLLCTDVIHSERRAEEAAMSADALVEAGIEPVMTRATSAVLQRSADMRLKEHFGGEVPKDHKVAVAAIDRSLREGALV
jgi:3-hydroxyisobutyrate dehydrogenase-like beta-hydroxyacid dehydrogenase